MYKHLTIDDFIKFDIYNNNKSKLIITNNKLKDICNIYIYEIEKIDKLYYLYYFINKYDYKKNNILIHYFINNIEKRSNNKKNLNYDSDLNNKYIGSYTTLSCILQYLNEQCKKNHKNHYFIYNSKKNKDSTAYCIQEINKLIKK